MEKMKKVLSISFLIMLVMVFTIGCSSITIPGENGEEMEIDLSETEDGNVDVSMKASEGNEESFEMSSDGESATISSSDGETSFSSQSGENVSLPKSFPKDFPMPSGAELIAVSEMNDLAREGVEIDSVSYNFSGDINKAMDDFKTFAESNGYEIVAETNINGMLTIQAEKGENEYFSGSLIPEAEDETQIAADVQIGSPN
ncbi:hypothetical protein GCM10008986_27730 [Salinibacillus aidingensis]|uniref:Uncharacterized protein n=2 Tax=Salinibacillus aidingensis TaxID=237684 RepID=A0ABN1BJM1_9BACI